MPQPSQPENRTPGLLAPTAATLLPAAGAAAGTVAAAASARELTERILSALAAALAALRGRIRGTVTDSLSSRYLPDDVATAVTEELLIAEEADRRAGERVRAGLRVTLDLPTREMELERLERDLARELAASSPDARRISDLTRALERQRERDGPRERALRGLLRSEERYAAMRARAAFARAAAASDRARIRRESPEGAFWVSSALVREHTAGCILASGGGRGAARFLPWTVLDRVHPPRHAGCACRLVSLGSGRAMGLRPVFLSPGDAIRSMANVMQEGEAEGLLTLLEMAERGEPGAARLLDGFAVSWRPQLHPRDRDGKFKRKLGTVRVPPARTASAPSGAPSGSSAPLGSRPVNVTVPWMKALEPSTVGLMPGDGKLERHGVYSREERIGEVYRAAGDVGDPVNWRWVKEGGLSFRPASSRQAAIEELLREYKSARPPDPPGPPPKVFAEPFDRHAQRTIRGHLAILEAGKDLRLPDGTRIRKDPDGTYRVVRSGKIERGFTADAAAWNALDRSARAAKDEKSVGGARRYRDYQDFLVQDSMQRAKDRLNPDPPEEPDPEVKPVSPAHRDALKAITKLREARQYRDAVYSNRSRDMATAASQEADEALRALGREILPEVEAVRTRGYGRGEARATRDVLARYRKFGGETGVTPEVNASGKGNRPGAQALADAIDEEAEFIPTDWLRRVTGRPLVARKTTGRAFHSSGYVIKDGQMTAGSRIVGDPKDQPVVLHELMHAAEEMSPWLADVQAAFWEYRRKGEKVQRLRDIDWQGRNFKVDEVGVEDEFPDVYFGKNYREDPARGSDYSHFEILTMGAERAFYRRHQRGGARPLGPAPQWEARAQADAELDHFILGLLAAG